MQASEPLLQASQYLNAMLAYWWPFCRILALFSMAPLFNHKALSIRARVLLALALTIALGASLPEPPQIEPLSLKGLLTTLEQVLFGILLGLTLQLVFTIFMLVGEVISTQMGMSMARYNDPMNGVSSSSIVYQLYFILLVFLFLAIDGHLLTVSVVYQSFIYWPVGSGLQYLGFERFLQAIAWVFSAAVLITLPVVFCMTLVQFCFGLLNRISPAMNLFSLGFPITILVGLLCMYLTMPNLPENYLHLTRELLHNIGTILQEGADV
ncbi:MAG TPA: flagellar biosynthetic protein FliR [Pseudomonas sp.]|nr:flagellar biosynthetic protein FliR [Pseudomonas sp.]